MTTLITLAAHAIRDIRWAQVRAALLFGLVVFIVNVATFFLPILQLARSSSLARVLGESIVAQELQALCLLLAVVVADRAVDEGLPRRTAYVAAALIGCTIGALLSESLAALSRNLAPIGPMPASRPWLHGTAALWFRPLFTLTNWLLIGGAAVFLYADWRGARKTEARLHATELDRIRRSKLAMEARLQAMQARVEPRFLLNTLDQVEQLYELDASLASRMLDDLIAYLRAAMPLMRDTSSTLAQEIALVRAYLDIVRLRLGGRLDVAIEAPAGSEEVRMPPMMLLPLVDHAVVRGLEPATAGGGIRIRTEVRDGRLRLTIADRGAGFVPETAGEGVASIRDRLEALYGRDATLELRQAGAQATEAILDLPLERRGSLDDLKPALGSAVAPLARTAAARAR